MHRHRRIGGYRDISEKSRIALQRIVGAGFLDDIVVHHHRPGRFEMADPETVVEHDRRIVGQGIAAEAQHAVVVRQRSRRPELGRFRRARTQSPAVRNDNGRVREEESAGLGKARIVSGKHDLGAIASLETGSARQGSGEHQRIAQCPADDARIAAGCDARKRRYLFRVVVLDEHLRSVRNRNLFNRSRFRPTVPLS